MGQVFRAEAARQLSASEQTSSYCASVDKCGRVLVFHCSYLSFSQ
jgi:hypothetical protein